MEQSQAKRNLYKCQWFIKTELLIKIKAHQKTNQIIFLESQST